MVYSGMERGDANIRRRVSQPNTLSDLFRWVGWAVCGPWKIRAVADGELSESSKLRLLCAVGFVAVAFDRCGA